MTGVSPTIVAVFTAGLGFDFVNGFHDAANSIATIVATRVLKPKLAVLWAAFFNFIAVFIFGTAVARTMGAGLVDLAAVTPAVVLCGLAGAVAWGLMTWRARLPTSSSHALLGGYAGAAMAHQALRHGWADMGAPIIAAGWIRVLAFIVIAPVMGLFLARFLMSALLAAEKRFGVAPDHPAYKSLQLFSSAFLSLMHGSNDAQKTAGILAGALAAGGVFAAFTIPFWLLALSYGVMGLGTLAGGWRIVRTLGQRLTRLQPQGGFCAESAAAAAIFTATLSGLPVSTTHAVTGAVVGVGVASDPGRVRWTVARRIAWGWIFTIPAAAFMGGCAMVAGSFL